jgi:RNA polymerase-binding transcription factor DksA
MAIEQDVRNETNPVSTDSQEQSIERENDEVIDALGNSARAELKAINKALSRIESSEYFNCEECGEPISEGRLRSVPYTSLCVECAESHE